MQGACAQFIQHSEKVDVVRTGLKISVQGEQNPCCTAHYPSYWPVLQHLSVHSRKNNDGDDDADADDDDDDDNKQRNAVKIRQWTLVETSTKISRNRS